ncbi:MAG TPA: hypothetical protein VK504_05235 [Vicinamibacterales bacterium]|jgi:response regulator RpfG family c-di-GMP phosphodiesterase|nr:hypothetical protein [Vicinamibacterales bacterium]
MITMAKQRPSDTPATILLVDDEPAVREVQRRVLEAEGYLVTEAVSLLLYGTVGKPR